MPGVRTTGAFGTSSTRTSVRARRSTSGRTARTQMNPQKGDMMNESAMMTAESLDRAAEKLKSGWCKHTQGKTSDGMGVTGDHPDAVRWCAIGAVSRPGHPGTWDCPEIRALARYLGIEAYLVASWNNNGTQAEVVEAFHGAAKAIREGRLPV